METLKYRRKKSNTIPLNYAKNTAKLMNSEQNVLDQSSIEEPSASQIYSTWEHQEAIELCKRRSRISSPRMHATLFRNRRVSNNCYIHTRHMIRLQK